MPQELRLYRKMSCSSGELDHKLTLAVDYKIQIFVPTVFRKGLDKAELIKRNIWYLITLGKYKIVYIMHGNKIAHYSYIIPKNFRFPFMKKGDLQIGPCYTYPSYRGKGLYADALKYIFSIFSDEDRVFWIYTAQNNEASRHVIEKSGFEFQNLLRNSGVFRILKKNKD